MTTTHNETMTVSGSDIRAIADMIATQVISIHDAYGRDFPYDRPQLMHDLGQILLWGMAKGISVQFFDDRMVERVSYTYNVETNLQGENSDPKDFPRHKVHPNLHVRFVVHVTNKKSAAEVDEFYRELGWHGVPPLERKTVGISRRFGQFLSGSVGVSCYSYQDVDSEEYAL